MSEPTWECFVCGNPVSNADAHFCHRPGCKRVDCDCDYPCHPKCCPECQEEDKRGKANENWHSADELVPHNNLMVEIAAFCQDNSPPFWYLSHAWYNPASESWVRKGSEHWKIEYWRYSEDSLVELMKGKANE